MKDILIRLAIIVESRAFANFIAIMMCFIALWFVYEYRKHRKCEKDIADLKAQHAAEIAAKNDEIAKKDADNRRIGASLFEARFNNKIMRQSLDWERYRNEQLTKGVIVDDATRGAFIRERSSKLPRAIS